VNIKECNNYERSLNLVEELMLPYYKQYNLEWNRQKRKKLFQQSSHFSIYHEGAFSGILVYTQQSTELFILELEIVPDKQSLGLGTQALVYLDGIAKQAMFESISLNVFKSNPAYQFYLKNNFELVTEKSVVYFLRRALSF